MLITEGVLALDFACLCDTEIRQRGNRHLGIKCSQMRFDESQLHQITQREREYTTVR